ncbi:MAG: tRNA uracil 4-sulfurtransferase ThiI [Candidatus Aenigmarchaeota archaeon]|nr:tRNA 4-thiouridine(8) synthase ThiI [Candidatus Aenigmarchaeota archaeon]MDW8149797.1 tRNA uracil 4-sulfurtransferase ThiI [Candidatus Aenigmarchaeota archaeon]
MAVIVFFGEIFLKGKNRAKFINRLENNIKNSIKSFDFNIKKFHDRIVIESNEDEKIAKILSKVFGISTIYIAKVVERDLDVLSNLAIEEVKNRKTFCIRVERIDKSFPMTSKDVENYIGKKVVEKTNAIVDLENPEIEIKFKIYKDYVYYLKEKFKGAGGLPVGVSGEVISLISGGIDSAVSSFLIMKRGCKPDFLHFYAYSSIEEVEKSKIFELVRKIIESQKIKVKLFLVPYSIFHANAIANKINEKIELVLFRRFMIKVANELCKKYNYKAIVTGDNLVQVASQTLENLSVVDKASQFPILRPLLTYDKEEIIEIAKNISTYEISIREYKDCCSIISLHPATKSKLEDILAIEEKINIDKLVEESLKEMRIYDIE